MDVNDEGDRRSPRWLGPVIGLVTAGVALGVAHLVAGWVNAAASPIITVGEGAIDSSPTWLKSFAIRSFGTNDKRVLLLGIGVVIVLAAITLGDAALRRPRSGWIGLAIFVAVGAIAALTRPGASVSDLLPVLAGAVAGAVTLRALLGAADRPTTGPVQTPVASLDRRHFLWTAGVGAIVAIGAGGAGGFLSRRFRADDSRASVRLPAPTSPASDAPPGLDAVDGISPFFTPNDRFYRVDTALLVPAVTAEDWQLRIHGMVDRELTLTYDQLLARPLIERDVTLTCVSNPVGGHYLGNARWIGAALADILKEAGVHPGADQLVARSVDGFTVGTPTAALLDGRDAMLAIGMNGEPLPISHGFPVRVVVPGLYGYVSATKWVVDMELTTFGAYDAYWIARGWAQQAPIKTESRIDVPHGTVGAGQRDIAGIAWAQHVGIDAVEVQIDNGAWLPAELAPQDTTDTWRQWRLGWDAVPGAHQIAVRATDRNGVTQTSDLAEPFPDGATGYHTVTVTVH
ncbi:MAG: molybdopterin-dependent oxidoreductase [Actinomycetota bacterium]